MRIGNGSRCCWPGCFAIDSNISKIGTPTYGFDFILCNIADLNGSMYDDIEVVRRVPFLEDDLFRRSLKALEPIHDLFIGIASSFEEELMVQ